LTESGARVTRVALCALDVQPCNGCFGCWTTRPGECLVDDDARRLTAQAIASDLLAVATPARFGTWGSVAKSALDRMIGLLLPHFVRIRGEVHHAPRYARYPRLIALGTLPAANPTCEALFARLLARNALNFHCPAHAAAIVTDGDDAWAVARRLVHARAVPA
jgi:hypothetical protein